MLTIFIHPGRRFGQLVEALILGLTGGLLGAAWALLGIHLGSLVLGENPSATFAIRGIFFSIALLFHGFFRSHTPRLYNLVLMQVILCIIGLTTTVPHVTRAYATSLIYPLLMGGAVTFLVNICIFPEFSSSFLGRTAIETLDHTASALIDAGRYFLLVKHVEGTGLSDERAAGGQRERTTVISPGESNNLTRSNSRTTDSNNGASRTGSNKGHGVFLLSKLTALKAKLRPELTSCQAAQNECQFEIAYSVLPPRYMKGISKVSMGKLLANATAVIGACESRYALLGEIPTPTNFKWKGLDEESDALTANARKDTLEDLYPSDMPAGTVPPRPLNRDSARVEGVNELDLRLLKPKREIEFGDAGLLLSLLETIKVPYASLENVILGTVNEIIGCLAYAYVSCDTYL